MGSRVFSAGETASIGDDEMTTTVTVYPEEAYVINGTYCADRETALRLADAAASASVKGMSRGGYGPQILAAANERPLEEVTVKLNGAAFGRGSNPSGSLTGSVRVMRLRWASSVTQPAPASASGFGR